MNTSRVLAFGLLMMLCSLGFTERLSLTVAAQNSDVVTISGVVLDANNARIVDTLIKVENTKVRRQVKSDDEGRFRIVLPPGDYKITAEHSGFRRFELASFQANSGQCELVNIHLEVDVPKSTVKVN